MGNKKKARLIIIALGWYLIGTTWLWAFIYINYLAEGYKTAYWLSITFHYLSIYVAGAHFLIEGKDE